MSGPSSTRGFLLVLTLASLLAVPDSTRAGMDSDYPSGPHPKPAQPPAATQGPAPATQPAPGQAAALARRAADLLSQGKAEDAAPVFAMALAVDPTDPSSVEGRVRALVLSGRWNEALHEARRYAAALPNAPLAQTALGEALYRAGLFDEAAGVLEPLVAGNGSPDSGTIRPAPIPSSGGAPMPAPSPVPGSPPSPASGSTQPAATSGAAPSPTGVAAAGPPGAASAPAGSSTSVATTGAAAARGAEGEPPRAVGGTLGGVVTTTAPAPPAASGGNSAPPGTTAPVPPSNPANPISEPARGQVPSSIPTAGSTLLDSRLAGPGGPPARALLTLGLIRVAQGREDEGAALFDRALEIAPKERDVLFWAAGAAASRAEAVALLERYLALSDGDDPDRIEGARGTIRLYKALGERRVWVRESAPQRVEIPMLPLLDREAKITGYIVELSLGPAGRPGAAKTVRVLLDSGSTGLFLVERIAQKAGFAPLSEGTTFGGGGEGRAITRRGLIPSFGIGDLRFSDALASTTNQEIEPAGRYHGLLGMSVFDGYLVTLDLIRNRLILEAPPDTAGGSPYWTVESQMLVTAKTSTEKSGLFLFDTGAVRSLVSVELAGIRPSKSEAAVRGYGGLLAGSTTVHGARLQFQELQTPEPTLYAADLSQRSRLGGVEISGFLGLDLLSRTVIEIDTRHRRVAVLKTAKR